MKLLYFPLQRKIMFNLYFLNYITFKKIINYIDPEKKYISGILNRSHCYTSPMGYFVKDLRIFANRDLKNLIILDNLAISFGF